MEFFSKNNITRNDTNYEANSFSFNHKSVSISLLDNHFRMSKINDSYRQFKNYQSFQQATLVMLLNEHADIIFDKPTKKTTTTVQFPSIKAIIFGENDVVDVKTLIEQRCEEKIEIEKRMNTLTYRSQLRRFENNRFSECLHLLADFLFERGYFFEASVTHGKRGTQPVDMLNKIFLNNKLILKTPGISFYGKKVNEYINRSIEKDGCFKLNRNNGVLQKINSINLPTEKDGQIL